MKKLFILIFIMFSTFIQAEQLKIKVEKSYPIYEEVIISTPYKTYTEEVDSYECKSKDSNSIGLDTLIGITIGVVAGNQVKGNGKDAAKVLGGISGGYIANNTRNDTCYNKGTRKIPHTIYIEKKERILKNYKNCGYVNDNEICSTNSQKLDYIYLIYWRNSKHLALNFSILIFFKNKNSFY